MVKYSAEAQRTKIRRASLVTKTHRHLPSIPRPRILDLDVKAHLEYTSRIAHAFANHLARKNFRYTNANHTQKIVSGADAEKVGLAAGLHDLGKIDPKIHKAIAGTKRLSHHKREQMEHHVNEGTRIINEQWNNLPRTGKQAVLNGVRTHHEHFDGSGYPRGLHGTQIPIHGRILAVADVFCALTEERSYKKGMPTARAMRLIQKQSERLFDPSLVKEFIEFAENRNFELYRPTRRPTARK